MSAKNQQSAESEGRGSSWTGGRQLSARATTVILIGALLCGPLALGLAIRQGTAVAKPAPQAAAASGLTNEQQAAGDYALAYVLAWLDATRDEPGQLPVFVDVASTGGLSDMAWEHRDAAVASIAPVDGSAGMLSVVIAANVKQLAPTTAGDTVAATWPRRYFQVAVLSIAGTTRVVGLPAPIAGPAQGPAAQLVYKSDVSATDPAAEAVAAFLGAYLAGSGDISRYTAPGEAIAAITPAPYALVDVQAGKADKAPEAEPVDAAQLKVIVTVALANEIDQKATATYSLTLTARAGRWEVNAIDLAPQEAAPTGPASSSTPKP